MDRRRPKLDLREWTRASKEYVMKIFHAPNTRSVRIVWLCEELGLP